VRDTYLVDELEKERDESEEHNQKTHISHELKWKERE
jgi:hypothetical protein